MPTLIDNIKMFWRGVVYLLWFCDNSLQTSLFLIKTSIYWKNGFGFVDMQWSVGEDMYNYVFIFLNLVFTNDYVWLYSKHSKTFQGIVGFYFNMWSANALQAQGLKVVCVLCFCAEGDNVPDAFLIADGMHRFLNLGKKDLLGTFENTIIMMHNYFLSQSIIWSLTKTRAKCVLLEWAGAGVTWKIPISWTTVYGPPPDDTMFS